jgi:hypothetical protein
VSARQEKRTAKLMADVERLECEEEVLRVAAVL